MQMTLRQILFHASEASYIYSIPCAKSTSEIAFLPPCDPINRGKNGILLMLLGQLLPPFIGGKKGILEVLLGHFIE